VPTVSFMIASLGGYAFHSFATGLGGIVQSQSHASAGEVARGSFNAGQVTSSLTFRSEGFLLQRGSCLDVGI